MKLYWSSRSPFARKVTVAAHELGLTSQIEFIATVVSTMRAEPDLVKISPLSQIPALVLPEGEVIQDSLVICEYLDSLVAPPRLFPPAGPARWRALSRHAVGQALMETLVKKFAERKRCEDPLHSDYLRAYMDKFRRVASALETETRVARPSTADIGDIAIACALSYADFRSGEENWREGRPHLAAWHAEFAQRPSMRATDFQESSP